MSPSIQEELISKGLASGYGKEKDSREKAMTGVQKRWG